MQTLNHGCMQAKLVWKRKLEFFSQGNVHNGIRKVPLYRCFQPANLDTPHDQREFRMQFWRMRMDSHAISHFKELCPWVVQKGTILTNPGPLGENTVAHMTQQNTRLCLASIRGTKRKKWGLTWCTCGGPWKLCERRTDPHHRGQAPSCKQQFNDLNTG